MCGMAIPRETKESPLPSLNRTDSLPRASISFSVIRMFKSGKGQHLYHTWLTTFDAIDGPSRIYVIELTLQQLIPGFFHTFSRFLEKQIRCIIIQNAHCLRHITQSLSSGCCRCLVSRLLSKYTYNIPNSTSASRLKPGQRMLRCMLR